MLGKTHGNDDEPVSAEPILPGEGTGVMSGSEAAEAEPKEASVPGAEPDDEDDRTA